ncbi:hypothetical protein Q31a_18430 [Aureliella helgolandensis]|uniref:Uncharacterized protein n=1 Tax=Aureliella helgolandensis TaxID=2527968 RepID=A0A518G4N6_9BACT|nr:hypothetical protein Q31a_18430 [Aureliella helgolandensis]
MGFGLEWPLGTTGFDFSGTRSDAVNIGFFVDTIS